MFGRDHRFLVNGAQRVVLFLVTVVLGPLIGAATLLAQAAPYLREGLTFPDASTIAGVLVFTYGMGFLPATLSACLSLVASMRLHSLLAHLVLSPVVGGVSTLLVALLIMALEGRGLGSPTAGGMASLASLGAVAALGSTAIAYALVRTIGLFDRQ